MEVLLTLESVVDNLAECLKNNDLMAILTRFVSPVHVFMLKKAVFLFKHTSLFFAVYFIPEPRLQIFSPVSSCCPTGRAQGSSILEEKRGADIRGAPLSPRSLERRTGGLISLAVPRWTASRPVNSRCR